MTKGIIKCRTCLQYYDINELHQCIKANSESEDKARVFPIFEKVEIEAMTVLGNELMVMYMLKECMELCSEDTDKSIIAKWFTAKYS